MSMITLIAMIITCASVGAYNEEKPIYKWSPIVFRNLKKDASQLKCGAERTLCGFRWPAYGMLMKIPCCEGLVCEQVGTYKMCLQPMWEQNEINLLY